MPLDLTQYFNDNNIYVVPRFEADWIRGNGSPEYPFKLSDNAKKIEWFTGQYNGEDVIYFLEYGGGVVCTIDDVRSKLDRLRNNKRIEWFTGQYKGREAMYFLEHRGGIAYKIDDIRSKLDQLQSNGSTPRSRATIRVLSQLLEYFDAYKTLPHTAPEEHPPIRLRLENPSNARTKKAAAAVAAAAASRPDGIQPT